MRNVKIALSLLVLILSISTSFLFLDEYVIKKEYNVIFKSNVNDSLLVIHDAELIGKYRTDMTDYEGAVIKITEDDADELAKGFNLFQVRKSVPNKGTKQDNF